ncbi:endoglucanase 24-like protein [Tanacetum coccineum]
MDTARTDPGYSYTLLRTASGVFEFADTYRGAYIDNTNVRDCVCPFYCNFDGYQFLSIPMASNKSFVSSPVVDDCVSVVNSKPSVTELTAVNDETFMVDKKHVNVTDVNLVSDEKVSISDRDDLEKKIDDVQVLNNVVCVDRNKDVYGSEAKTSAAVDSVVIKEVGSDNVDVNTDDVIADEDVDLAGNNVFVADKKSFLGDEDVDFCEKNYVVSEQKMFIGDEDVDFAQNNYVVLNV